MITACLDAVIIRPASLSGRNRFDPSRISVLTRTGEALDVRHTGDGGLQLVGPNEAAVVRLEDRPAPAWSAGLSVAATCARSASTSGSS